MGEYAAVTAAIGLLASSLAGAYGAALRSSDVKTAALLAGVARSHHLSASQARAAYTKAPYSRPALRYLYAVGWLSAASNSGFCKLGQVLEPDPDAAPDRELRSSSKILTVLHSAHVTVSEAATAIGRDTRNGCTY